MQTKSKSAITRLSRGQERVCYCMNIRHCVHRPYTGRSLALVAHRCICSTFRSNVISYNIYLYKYIGILHLHRSSQKQNTSIRARAANASKVPPSIVCLCRTRASLLLPTPFSDCWLRTLLRTP